MHGKSQQTQADMMLLLVSLCWGVSYFMMDICLRELGTFTLNIYRFVGAFLLITLLFPRKMRHISFTPNCLVDRNWESSGGREMGLYDMPSSRTATRCAFPAPP